jgi:hypothetical protein
MSVNINASTTNGLVLTSDTSGEIKLQANGADIATVDSSGITMASGKGLAATGHVLQVVSSTKTDTFSSVASTFTDVTGLSVSITPTALSSKILVTYNVFAGEFTNQFQMLRLVRNSTPIGIGDASGSRQQTTTSSWTAGLVNSHSIQSASFLDSPASVSSLTYKIQILGQAGSTTYINRIQRDDNAAYEPRGISSITVMEIAG